jgi:sulfur carrier protein
MQEPDDMSITLNDVAERVPVHSSLEAVIELFGEADPDMIVELNGRFVYPRAYAGTIIRKGDRIEFINPNFGG